MKIRTISARIKSLKEFLPKGFTVTAHTGCCGTRENSIESMEKGLVSGADIVEFDLRFNKNGEAVLSHDEADENAVPLFEALEFLSEHKGVLANVDVKDTSNLSVVQSMAEKFGVLDRIFFTGINSDFVSAARDFCPGVSYYLNFSALKGKNTDDKYLQKLIETVTQSGAVGINMHYKGASKKLVNAFHENGLLVSLWTVNGKRNFYTVLKMLPDNITTKEPDKLLRLLK